MFNKKFWEHLKEVLHVVAIGVFSAVAGPNLLKYFGGQALSVIEWGMVFLGAVVFVAAEVLALVCANKSD